MTQFAAYQGTELRCQNWRAEALLRLLENVLDVGECPEGLVIYASIGKAAKDWDAFHQVVDALKTIWGGLTAAAWQYTGRLLRGFSAGSELGSAASGLATSYPSADVCTGNLSALQDYGGSAPGRWLCQSVCQGSTRGTATRRGPRARRRFRNGNLAGQKRKSCPGG